MIKLDPKTSEKRSQCCDWERFSVLESGYTYCLSYDFLIDVEKEKYFFYLLSNFTTSSAYQIYVLVQFNIKS